MQLGTEHKTRLIILQTIFIQELATDSGLILATVPLHHSNILLKAASMEHLPHHTFLNMVPLQEIGHPHHQVWDMVLLRELDGMLPMMLTLYERP